MQPAPAPAQNAFDGETISGAPAPGHDLRLGDESRLTDIPGQSCKRRDSQHRFIQFSFEEKWFCLDMPCSTLCGREAEQILRRRSGFFYLSDRPEFTLYGEDVEGLDPFRKIYIYATKGRQPKTRPSCSFRFGGFQWTGGST